MFPSKAHLRMHVRVHTGERPFICRVCGQHACSHAQSYGPANQLLYGPANQLVERTHEQITSLYNAHMIRQPTCRPAIADFQREKNVSFYSARRRRVVHRHRQTDGRTDRQTGQTYTIICRKFWPSRAHLEMHVRTHTGEKPFACPVCGKRFNQKGSMKSHVFQVHMNASTSKKA
ncbi:hypothetical protein DPMN_021616 [Dreissena polymorpha]|uniref:C2H2-type domain-containing protein n=1 Tax=Dreissena polymorpha TaxID=45954 RepID=A0A9D4NMH0_DREPO|nr:hypothetical protein DPMN_021616 [Dreissena polymorpha]